MGYDSDHPRAEGEVGKVGVAIDSIADMRLLLADIPLDTASMSMTINSTGAILLLLYELVAEEQGVAASEISGTIQNDILKEYIARGTYIYPPRPSMRIITDIFEYCAANVPKWNTISISGYHIREAGSTAVQEIAFTIANGIAYVEAALAAGMDIDEFAPRLSFFWNAHNNFFEEVAKFRAARRIWYRLMNERFGAKKESSKLLALPHPDRWLDADRAAAGEQRRARRRAVDGRGDGRHAEPAHQRLRRGAQPADAAGRAGRAAHPADHRLRERHRRHPRSAGRFVLRRDRSPTRSSAWRGSTSSGSTSMGGAVEAIEAGLPEGRDRPGRLRVRQVDRRRRADHRRRQQVRRWPATATRRSSRSTPSSERGQKAAACRVQGGPRLGAGRGSPRRRHRRRAWARRTCSIR